MTFSLQLFTLYFYSHNPETSHTNFNVRHKLVYHFLRSLFSLNSENWQRTQTNCMFAFTINYRIFPTPWHAKKLNHTSVPTLAIVCSVCAAPLSFDAP